MTAGTAVMITENEAAATREWCRDRAAVYTALAELYGRSLSEKWVKYFASPGFISLVKSLAFSSDDDATQLAASLDVFRQAADGQKAGVLCQALHSEYSNLFILGARETVHPYASVYLSEWKRVQGDAWLAARKFLHEAGYAVKEETFFEDHLSVQCEFVAALCKAAAKATKKKNSDKLAELLVLQERFLREHMLTWVPQYCQDLVRVSKHDFYSGAAKVTADFIRLDAHILKQIIEG